MREGRLERRLEMGEGKKGGGGNWPSPGVFKTASDMRMFSRVLAGKMSSPALGRGIMASSASLAAFSAASAPAATVSMWKNKHNM